MKLLADNAFVNRWGAAFGLLLMLVVGACSGEPGGEVGDSSRAISPISAALGIDIDGSFSDASLVGLTQNTEAQVQRCMAERGFEYRVPEIDIETYFGSRVGAAISDEEWARRYGLGVATIFLENFGPGAGLAAELSAPQQPDPNDEILEELGEQERSAWVFALSGSPSEGPDSQGADTDLVLSCQDLARASTDKRDAALEPVWDEISRLEERIASDPRVVRAEQRWSACMAEGGFSFETQDGMRPVFRSELREIVGGGASAGQVQQVGEQFDAETIAAISEMATREVEAATASLDCATGKSEVYDVVRYELEGELVEDASQVFADVRDRLEQLEDGAAGG